MSSPQLTIFVEPFESGAVVYLPLAPKALSEPKNGQVSLVINIRNNERETVRVKQLTASFRTHPHITPTVMALAMDIAPSDLAGISFETSNNIIVPEPAPEEITISILCDGFIDPATFPMDLRPYQSPVAGGSYSFPASTDDLRSGEYWLGGSAAHASGNGTQLFGYDMGVYAYDPAAAVPGWSYLRPGTDGTQNEHFFTFGKPIYAMADGIVISFKDDIPNNTPTIPRTQDRIDNDPVEGSHFRIQHGLELVTYAHLDPDSMDRALKPEPMQDPPRVTRGQFLGRAGNSGNSTSPHLHLHAMKFIESLSAVAGSRQERLRPIPFSRITVVDRTRMEPPDRNAPWVRVEDRGLPGELPTVQSLIWPAVAERTQPDLNLQEWFPRRDLRTRVWLSILVLTLAVAAFFVISWLWRS